MIVLSAVVNRDLFGFAVPTNLILIYKRSFAENAKILVNTKNNKK